MPFNNSTQFSGDFVVPAKLICPVNLYLDRGKGRHPTNLAITQLCQLLAGHKETVLHRGDSPFDNIFDTIGSRGVGKRLESMCRRRFDKGTNLVD